MCPSRLVHLAGAVVSESPLSHQVGADVLPFREAFSVLFFVSVGMLVNPAYLVQNIGPVLALAALIMIGKPLIVLLMGFFFSRSAFTMLVIAAGLSQIGEFSFILGQAGLSLDLLQQDQYSLILAGALVSITLNPMMFRLISPVQRALQRFLGFGACLTGTARRRRCSMNAWPITWSLSGMAVGEQVVSVAQALNIQHLVIESDVERVNY